MRAGRSAFLGGVLGSAFSRVITRASVTLLRGLLIGGAVLLALFLRWWQQQPAWAHLLTAVAVLGAAGLWLWARLGRPRPAARAVPAGAREPIPAWLRRDIIDRDGSRCGICGFPCTDPARIHIDHIHPVHAGGTNSPDNLQCAHDDCNLRKAGTVGWQPPYRSAT